MADHDDLLKRFQPVLRYDSNEQFFADSAEQFMVNPGNELRRKRTATGNGAVLASAQPTATARSTLDVPRQGRLRRRQPGRRRATSSASAGKNYREQYRKLRMARPELNNVVYGHAIEANGRLWLQYWLWYFYNDYQLSFGAGTHEGDWEMVQFRMDDEAGHPDIAVYAQHSYARDAPVGAGRALPARRPAAGRLRRARLARVVLRGRLSPDRGVVRPRRRQAPHEAPPDARDPRHRRAGVDALARPLGRHAASKRATKVVESNSPTGPGAKKQWTDPDRLLDNKVVPKHGKARDAAGGASPSARAAGCASSTTSPQRDPRPHTLVVTVNSEDEHGAAADAHARPCTPAATAR